MSADSARLDNQESKPPESSRPATFEDTGASDPPRGWGESLRFLGPGLIVVGAVVGSGELIVTTLLGAKVGFVVLWMIILSCLVKIIIQEQLAFYVITSGDTLIDGLNRIPGPRVKDQSWLTWLLFLFLIFGFFSVAGILGMTGATMFLLFGSGSINVWVLIIALVTVLFFWKGTYDRIEKIFVVMVAGFSLSLVIALVLTQQTRFSITWTDLWAGLKFQLPPSGAYIATAAFGSTGVSAAEIVYYTYWCLEKGYAKYAGPPEDTEEWRQRASGWISVMRKDLLLMALIYTGVTVSFYLLGAAILHRTQSNAANLEGLAVASAISDIFTQSFGAWSFYAFMIGAFFVLYSTYVAACASLPRFTANFFERLRRHPQTSKADRNRGYNVVSIVLASFLVLVQFLIPKPVALIMFFGGVLATLFLPILGLAAIYFNWKREPRQLAPGPVFRILLWVCTFAVLGVVATSLRLQFSQ